MLSTNLIGNSRARASAWIFLLACFLLVGAPAFAQCGYCAAGHQNLNCTFPTPFISNVTIASLSNSSTCGPPPGYEDYTALPGPTLPRQVATSISVTIALSPWAGGFARVLCDWNSNCLFESSESTVLSNGGSGLVFTGTITPPAGAVASTRMRVRFAPFAMPSTCGTSDMGNTEDYTVMTVSPMSVVWSSPLGAGSVQVDITGGPPSGFYFLAVALAQGTTPNGWFFGLDIGLTDVVDQFFAGYPFVGPLDGAGNTTVGPLSGLPPGFALWSVALGFTSPPPVTPSDASPIASWVIP